MKQQLVSEGKERLYQCPECGLHYTDERTMRACRAWCSQHKSCNYRIAQRSVERRGRNNSGPIRGARVQAATVFTKLQFIDTVWFFFLIFGLDAITDLLTHSYIGDFLAIIYFVANGAYCLRNFLDCHKLLCAFTGLGFPAAAAFMVLRVSRVFDHGFGAPYILVAIAAVAGHITEQRAAKMKP